MKIKYRYIVGFFLFAVSHYLYANILTPVATPNLVSNPGFEENLNNIPVGWRSTSKTGCCKLVKDESHGGNYSILIESSSKGGVKWESEYINHSVPNAMDVSAWMKTQDVKLGKNLWNKVVIALEFYDEKQKSLKIVDLVREEGTHDWTQYKKTILPPSGTKYVKLLCYFSGSAGRAWFDDVSIKSLPKYVGKRFSTSKGKSSVEITVNAEKVVGDIGNVNGIFPEQARMKLRGVEEMKPTIIRTPMLHSHHYYLMKFFLGKGPLGFYWNEFDREIEKIVQMNAIPFISIGWVPKQFEMEIKNKDYSRWEKFIYILVSRYSKTYDVSKWYWNFWNEPGTYRKWGDKRKHVNWFGTEDEFYKFYDITVNAALKANNKIKIGGAGFANHSPWMPRFIKWCGENGKRLDFVSWHSYGVVPEEISNTIKNIRYDLSKYSATKNTEIIIDEWSSYYGEGGRLTREEYSRGNYAAAYRIASISKMISEKLNGNIWFNTYDDNYGVLAKGEQQATYKTFILYSELGNRLIHVQGDQEDPYIDVTAALDKRGNAGVIISYFKHMFDSTKEEEKNIKLHMIDSKEKTITYRLYLNRASSKYKLPDQITHGLKFIGEVVKQKGMHSALINIDIKPNTVLLIKAY